MSQCNLSFSCWQNEDVWSWELEPTPFPTWRFVFLGWSWTQRPPSGWGSGGGGWRPPTARTMGDRSLGATGRDGANHSHVLFDNFVQASTCKGTLKAFQELCDHLDVKPTESRIFYHKLKSKLNYWKAKALWAKLDKRACQKEYKKGRACTNSKVTLDQTTSLIWPICT